MGETYINPHEVHNHGDSGSTLATSSTIATLDGSVDEPPIRSAGSPHHLTEKSGGETRYIQKTPTIEVVIDKADIATCAHILTGFEVARRLETDAEYVYAPKDQWLSTNDYIEEVFMRMSASRAEKSLAATNLKAQEV
jgi:hypothetical protein